MSTENNDVVKEEGSFFDKMKDKVADLAHKAEEVWDKVEDKMEDAWDATKEKAAELKDKAEEKFDELKEKAEDKFEELTGKGDAPVTPADAPKAE